MWNLQSYQQQFWMKECDIFGVKTYCDPSYIFSVGEDPSPPGSTPLCASMRSAVLIYQFCPSLHPSISHILVSYLNECIWVLDDLVAASLVFWALPPLRNSKGGRVGGGVKYTGVGENWRFLTEIAVCHGNETIGDMPIRITNRKSEIILQNGQSVGSCDLEWPWRAWRERWNFTADFH